MLQVCYVVVSNGWDHHAQMAWLSAWSVRLQEPKAKIVVVAEGLSAEANDVLVSKFGSVAHQILLKTSDVKTPVAKSRFHKIALRQYLADTLLYLDSDTLAIGPFATLGESPDEVGAVSDFNFDIAKRWFPANLEQPFRELGWEYPLPYYLNAGVILMRDTPGVHAFCREWLLRFQASSALPHVWDQATFNSALIASGVSHHVLPNRFNAMVVKRNYRFRSSSILHFFGSADEQRGTILQHLLRHVNETGTFDEAAYRRCLKEHHPWGPGYEPWQLWKSRNYVRAAALKMRRAAGTGRQLTKGGSN